jgi:membrane protein implicated in regulation of membrane protease activity
MIRNKIRWILAILCYVLPFIADYIFSLFTGVIFFCILVPEEAEINFFWTSLIFSAVVGTELVLLLWYLETFSQLRRNRNKLSQRE